MSCEAEKSDQASCCHPVSLKAICGLDYGSFTDGPRYSHTLVYDYTYFVAPRDRLTPEPSCFLDFTSIL